MAGGQRRRRGSTRTGPCRAVRKESVSMGRCRVVAPETVRLPISDGDWVEVKKTLNYGESRKFKGDLYTIGPDGRAVPNMQNLGHADVMAYLVDWSMVGLDGKPIAIDTDARRLA